MAGVVTHLIQAIKAFDEVIEKHYTFPVDQFWPFLFDGIIQSIQSIAKHFLINYGTVW